MDREPGTAEQVGGRAPSGSPRLVSQTTAPDPTAPETRAPETSAPETIASETSAPETSASETRASRAVPPWVFWGSVAGRLWLALVTGTLLIATLPALLLPGWSAHVVMSDSMTPRINTGDVVLSQARDDYRPGQVIVFDSADRGAMMHRLQAVNGDTFTTKGDANPTPDSTTIGRGDVIGLGRVLVMFAGLPWVWAHTGQWLPLVLFLLSLVLAAWLVSRDRPSEHAAPAAAVPGAPEDVLPWAASHDAPSAPPLATAAADPGELAPEPVAADRAPDAQDPAEPELVPMPEVVAESGTVPGQEVVAEAVPEPEAVPDGRDVAEQEVAAGEAVRDDADEAPAAQDDGRDPAAAPAGGGEGAADGGDRGDADEEPEDGGSPGAPGAPARPRRRTRRRRPNARDVAPTAAAAVAAIALVTPLLPGASAVFSARSTNDANTWQAGFTSSYASVVAADSPYVYLRLNEAQPTGTSTTASAANSGSSASAYLYTKPSGAWSPYFVLASATSANLTPTPLRSARLVADGACILAPSGLGSLTAPQSFSLEAWINSTGSAGGKIAGFENSRTATMSTQYDRHLYQDGNGYVYFGIWTGAATTVVSPTPLNDGSWHHVVGTLTGANGTMSLYVDGQLAQSLTGITAESTVGWWRFGCGNLSGWTGAGAWTGTVPSNLAINHAFVGFVDEVAAYSSALSASAVRAHWNVGRP